MTIKKLTPKQTEQKNQDNEFKALAQAFKVFADLDVTQRQRVYSYLGQRFGLTTPQVQYPWYYNPHQIYGTSGFQSTGIQINGVPVTTQPNPTEYQIFCNNTSANVDDLPVLDPKDYSLISD